MLISHTYKFIFIKPTKVAGTSVEITLAKYCQKDDVVTPQREYSSKLDIDDYSYQARNFKGFWEHMTPAEIKEKIGHEIWNSYTKIAIVRNPWDYVVSRYLWEYTKMFNENRSKTLYLRFKHFFLRLYFRHIKKKYIYSIFDFDSFVQGIPKGFMNYQYYFDKDDIPYPLFILRYENLQNDFDALCDKLGIPRERLPRVNVKHTKQRKRYIEFYNNTSQELVRQALGKEIDFFGYKFGE